MSVSIVILKKIDEFSYEDTLNSIQKASIKANIHCIHLKTIRYFSSVLQTEFDYLSGTLSEVTADILKSNFERGIHTKPRHGGSPSPLSLSTQEAGAAGSL